MSDTDQKETAMTTENVKAISVKKFIQETEATTQVDDDVFDNFQCDFEDWSVDDFKTAGGTAITELRNFLLGRGVYVNNHRTAGSNQFATMQEVATVAEPLAWTQSAALNAAKRCPIKTYNEQLHEMVGLQHIDSAYHPYTSNVATVKTRDASETDEDADNVIAQQLGQLGLSGQEQPRASRTSQDARTDPRIYQQQQQRQQPYKATPTPFTSSASTSTKWLFNDHSNTSSVDKEQVRILQQIQKHYPTDAKYSGTADMMSLDYRVNAFLGYCSDVGLANDYICKALPAMMAAGEPFDHCQDLRQQLHDATDWRNVLHGMTYRFESPAITRSRSNRWQSLSLYEVAKEMPDRPLSDAVRALYERLARTQRCLEPEFSSPKQLFSRLVNALEQHHGTAKVVAFVASTASSADSLITMVQDGVKADERTAAMTPPATAYAAEALYADRTYQRNGGNNNYRSTAYRGERNTANNSTGTRKPFKCYICGKEGCRWSEHTEEEKAAHKKNWQKRTNRTYFADMEEIEGERPTVPSDDEEDQDVVDAYITSTDATGDGSCEPYTTFWAHLVDNTDDVTASKVEELTGRRDDHALVAINEPTEAETKAKSIEAPFIGLSRYNDDEFMGFIVDTGAAVHSTCGVPQLTALQKLRSTIKLNTSTAGAVCVQFGIGAASSSGSAMIETPIGSINFHALPIDTPFLISLADMDRLTAYLNNIRNVVVSPDGETPVLRRFGHAFIGVPETAHSFGSHSYYTAAELKRLHRRFGHPSVDRLYNLLRAAGDDDVNREDLQEIRDFCSNCQKHQGPPRRFKFNIREDQDVVFNGTILVDVAYIEGKPYIHVIDQATGFMAARWLSNMTAQHTWDKLRECWLDTYVGPPDFIVHDRGTNFASQDFKDNAALLGSKVKAVPTEAHHSIGQAERYHGMIERAYTIISSEVPELSPESALQMAIKAINDTAGPNGIVPTLLVFGAYPRLSTTASPSATVSRRAAAIKVAMRELEKQRAQRQVADALRQRNGPDPVQPALNDLVLVWRPSRGSGSTATAAGWHGPYRVRAVDDEEVTVDFGNGILSPFRSTSVRIYKTTEPDTVAASLIPVKRGRGRPRKVVQTEALMTEEVPAGAYAALYGPTATLWMTAPMPTPSYDVSRRAEIFGLLEKEVFEPFPRAELPPHVRIFNGRFVDEIKHAGTAQAVEKSRFVVQAHSDSAKVTVLTESPTIQRMSQRVLLCVTACQLGNAGMQLLLRDISQAYVQSSTPLQREFYVNPNAAVREILALPEDAVLRIMKPLYGVPEAGNHWFATYSKHHVEALGMTQSTYDACLMVRNDDAFGLVGLQTDDTLILADERFAALEESALQKAGFLAKPREALSTENPLKFNGGILQLAENGDLSLSQEGQVLNISLVGDMPTVNKGTRGKVSAPLGTEQQYVAQRARGAYVASVCQPEAAFDLSSAAQHTNPGNDEIDALNARLEWQTAHPTRGLRFVKLDESTIQVVTFTDAAFANNKDLSSQIGYVVTIRDASGKCNIVHWSSTKCRRVTKSILAAELYAFVQGFDVASCIKATMDRIYGRQIPLVICTDNKGVYDTVTRLGVTTEKRLMIDVAMLRQSYERREVTEVKWITGNSNPADAMTKGTACKALTELVDTNYIDLKEEAWVERT